jgi:hypothetical protein
VRRSGWRRPTASMVKTPIKLGKESLAQSLSCTCLVRTLGHTSSAMGSTGARAYRCRRRSPAGCAVETGALARRSQNLGQKEHESVRSNSTKGIIKWPGNTAASRR